MAKKNSIVLCKEYMFADVDAFADKVTEQEKEKVLRCRQLYLWFVEHPQAKDADFVNECIDRFDVTRPTAYADLATVKALLPDLSKTAKEFHRWRFNQMILDTYEAAKKKGDTRTMEKAASSYAKYNKVDTDREEINLSEIIPQPFVATTDPSVLGIDPIPNLKERKRQLLERMTREVSDVQDIKYEEIDVTASTSLQDFINGAQTDIL